MHAHRATVGEDLLEVGVDGAGEVFVLRAEHASPVDEEHDPGLVGATGQGAVLGDGAGPDRGEALGALVDDGPEHAEQSGHALGVVTVDDGSDVRQRLEHPES